MSLSAMGSRYGRAKVKQEGGDTEMEDLTLVIMPISRSTRLWLILCFCKVVSTTTKHLYLPCTYINADIVREKKIPLWHRPEKAAIEPNPTLWYLPNHNRQ